MASWNEIKGDPDFNKLPSGEKKKVVDWFLESDEEFLLLPKTEKEKVKKHYYSESGVENAAFEIAVEAAEKATQEPYAPIKPRDAVKNFTPGESRFLELTKFLTDPFNVRPEYREAARRREEQAYAGMSAEEATEFDSQHKSIKSDLYDAVSESTLAKMLQSYKSPEEQARIQSSRPEGYQYLPKHEMLHGVANILADSPLYAAGGAMGGPAGTFMLPAMLRKLYEAKLAGELPTDVSAFKYITKVRGPIGKLFMEKEGMTTQEKQMFEAVTGIAKEGSVSAVEGTALGLLGGPMGTLAQRLGKFRLTKKVPEKLLEMAVRTPAMTGTLTAIDQAAQQIGLRDKRPFSPGEFGQTLGQVAIMEALGVLRRPRPTLKERIKEAKEPVTDSRIQLVEEIKKAKESGTVGEVLQNRVKEEYRPSTKPAPDYRDRVRPMKDVDVPLEAIRDKGLDMEPWIKTHYPEGWDSRQQQVKERMKNKPAIREMLDRSLQVWIDDIKYAESKDPGTIQRMIKNGEVDMGEALKFFDLKKLDKLSQEKLSQVSKSGKRYYRDMLEADMKDYIKRYSDYDTIEQIRADKEGQKPYQTKHERDEFNREAIEALGYIPPTEPYQGHTSREQAAQLRKVEREIAGKESLIGQKLTEDMVGEPKIQDAKMFDDVPTTEMPTAAAKIVKDTLDIDAASRKVFDRIGKENIGFVKDYFVSSMGRAVAERTEAGKGMVEGVYKNYQDIELTTGDKIQMFRDAIKPIAKNKKTLAKYEQTFIDIMDKGVEYVNERRKLNLEKISDKEYDVVKKAAVDARKILDTIHADAVMVGLKEYHPKVGLWKIIELKDKTFVVIDSKGEILKQFEYEKDARDYKNDRLFTKISYKPNYFPHVVDKKILKDIKAKRNLVDYLIKKKLVPEPDRADKLTPDQVRKFKEKAAINMIEGGVNLTEQMYGHLQNSRDFNIPDRYLRRDLHVLESYIEEATARIERAKAYGTKDEGLYQQAIEVAKEAAEKYDYSTAQAEWNKALHLANTITGRLVHDPRGTAITNALLNFQVVRKMVTSSIGQVPQMMAGIWRGNLTSWAKAVKSMGLNHAESKRFVTRCGINLEMTRRGILGTMGEGDLAANFLRRTGFVHMDAAARSVAAMTGRYYAEFLRDKLLKKYTLKDGKIFKGKKEVLYKKGDALDIVVRNMEKLNIDPKEVLRTGELSDMQLRRAANTFETETNFRAREIDLPEFRQSNLGKFTTQFKSFMYSMTKTIRNHVWGEMKHGNIQPLLYMMLVSGMSGTIVNEVRGWITGRESGIKQLAEGDLWKLVDGLSAAGALGMMEMGLAASKYGDPQFGAMFNDIQQMFGTVGNVYKAEKWDTKRYILTKDLANQLPLGSRWRRTVQMLHNADNVSATDLLILPAEKVQGRSKSNRKGLGGLGGLKGL